MKTHHYLAVVIRLFALILFLYTIKQLLFVTWYKLIFISIGIIASALLWMFPFTVSKTIVTASMNKEINPTKAKEFLTLLVIILGFFTLFYAIPDRAVWIIVHKWTFDQIIYVMGLEKISNIFVTTVELLLSILLITKSKNIVSYLISTVRVL